MKERCYCCNRVESAKRPMKPREWHGRLRMICDECAAQEEAKR